MSDSLFRGRDSLFPLFFVHRLKRGGNGNHNAGKKFLFLFGCGLGRRLGRCKGTNT